MALPFSCSEFAILHIEEDIAIRIGDIVALALCIVNEHVCTAGIEDFSELIHVFLGLRAGDSCLDTRSIGLASKEGLLRDSSHAQVVRCCERAACGGSGSSSNSRPGSHASAEC